MSKIFMFSDMYLPTFPYLEMPLYNELSDQGIDVVYVLQEGDVRLADEKLSVTFANLNLLKVKKPAELLKHMKKGDLLLSRFAYKLPAGDLAAKVRSKGHKILMYDPSGIDIRVRSCPAQYLTAKSESLKAATLKKFPKQYKKIFVTGTIHNDAAAITTVNRDTFMRAYGMDPERGFVILTPANPGELGHQKNIDNLYAKIVETVRTECPDYELAIKAHPLDYTAKMKNQPGVIHKNEHYSGKCSWETFAPGITVIKADEGYMAIQACDAVLNVRSSIAMETALLRTPLININRAAYTTNWKYDDGVMMDVQLEDLSHVLNTYAYSISDQACLEYIKREAFSDDGKAYKRTADIAIKILEGKE